MSKVTSFPPVYEHEFQQASENLRRTLPLVNQHKTPVNPVNYAVWYEYVSGDNAELVSAIDTRLSKNQPITAEVTQYLYEKYVLMGMPERLNHTNNGLKLVVDNTLQNINRVEATATSCSSGLSQSQSLLEQCNDIQELKGLVTEILSNTQQLTQSSHELKSELVRSSQEIMKLREELEAVKQSARTDGLTGLLNRGTFNRELGLLCQDRDMTFSLALFMLVIPVFLFFLHPLMTALSRKYEYEADDYAASVANADDLIAALVALYKENASTLTPDPLVSAVYDSHPPAALRIAHLQSGTA